MANEYIIRIVMAVIEIVEAVIDYYNDRKNKW